MYEVPRELTYGDFRSYFTGRDWPYFPFALSRSVSHVFFRSPFPSESSYDSQRWDALSRYIKREREWRLRQRRDTLPSLEFVPFPLSSLGEFG